MKNAEKGIRIGKRVLRVRRMTKRQRDAEGRRIDRQIEKTKADTVEAFNVMVHHMGCEEFKAIIMETQKKLIAHGRRCKVHKAK